METATCKRPWLYYRTAMVFFVLGALAGAFAGDFLRSAYAQIPNAAQQRQDMNSGMQQLNGTMSEVLSVLRTGTLKVRLVETDKTSGSGSRSSGDRGAGAPSHSPTGPVGGGSNRPSR